MTRGGADDVASETEGMTISKGGHGAKHFGAKTKNPCCAWERNVLLILSGALKLWRPRRRQGLCSHPANLWATADVVFRF